MTRFNAWNVFKNGLIHQTGWDRQWRDPIPKKEYEKITDMSEDEISALFSKIPKIVNGILEATNADAFSLAQNNGRAAKQIVPHVHVHIIPRYSSKETIWTKRNIPSDIELENLAEKIRNCIKN